jgi:hypothetical protein
MIIIIKLPINGNSVKLFAEIFTLKSLFSYKKRQKRKSPLPFTFKSDHRGWTKNPPLHALYSMLCSPCSSLLPLCSLFSVLCLHSHPFLFQLMTRHSSRMFALCGVALIYLVLSEFAVALYQIFQGSIPVLKCLIICNDIRLLCTGWRG